MYPADFSSLTPDQVAELRRKLEAAGCQPPPQAGTLSELAPAFATLRRRHGLPASATLDAATMRCLDACAGAVFGEVFEEELDLLRPEPQAGAGACPCPADRGQLLQRAHAGALAGLALSGGGVRSATFGLGVLQALAGQGLLRRMDYLSTVSGGGFIGGWLSKCIHAHGGDVAAAEAMLAQRAGMPEAQAVRFLRQYSNYLSPRGGVFSADTWTLVSTYVRNTGLNLAMLVAWLCALLLLPRAAVFGVHRVVGPGGPWAAWSDLAWIAGVLLFLGAVFCIALSISSKPESSRGLRRFPLSQGAVLWCINLPLMLAGFLGSVGLWRHGGAPAGMLLPARLEGRWAWLLAPGLVYFIVWACGWYLAHDRASPYRRAGYTLCATAACAVLLLLLEAGRAFAPEVSLFGHPTGERLAQAVWVLVALLLLLAIGLRFHAHLRCRDSLRDLTRAELGEGLSHFACAMAALTLGSMLLLAGLSLLPDPATHPVLNNAIALTTFGMPLMMALFAGTMTLMIGLLGRLYSDASREWWSRQGAWATIFALGWLAMFGVSFFFAPLLHWAWLTHAPWKNLGTLLGWLAMTAFGLKAGSGTGTGPGSSPRLVPYSRLDVAARLAPYVFTVGIFALLSALVQAAVAPPAAHCPQPDLACVFGAHARATLATDGARLALAFCLFLGAALLLGWRVDINKFSLYMLYRNRVVRAYFGASSRSRQPHPFTGFDPADDLLLADLRCQRPYPIINTSLNLVSGEELAWQTRKAASFSFTPRWCGFELPPLPHAWAPHGPGEAARGCYRPTQLYASRSGVGADDDAGVRLGMAVALSGAAASPNVGAHSSPPLNFLMTMFNVRLGRWCPNPRRPAWTSSSPPIGLFSLLAELFGLTNADASYVHLSDGGHFDNLGIYELVRRRCRLVIAVDVASDRQLAFEDLGNTIRRCATDLHVRIDLDVSRFEPDKDRGLCGASCAAGSIRYSLADRDGVDGTLLYIKPAIVGDENADLLNYRKLHPDFPHQSTADQWFDEAQFESYRALGLHIAHSALGAAARAARGPDGEAGIAALCAQLLRRHGPAARPPAAACEAGGQAGGVRERCR
ncbi:patatin-like phospholipase family protein [Massilia niastensis]|uniref:patatin-like phospholipase family protein n=1 Tax=Massilia niastensis TaxID=544911 RepID=UPI00037009C3|nr:patatin-like phospholipase family protein [Massilia niastensis]